jgi:hypothetical protein
MRLRSHRRSLVVWSHPATSVGGHAALPFTRIRRTRRWIRTGALIIVVGLIELARAGRAHWRFLLAGGVLTAAGVMLGGLAGGVLLFLAAAAFLPARPKGDRVRRSELEHELGVYSRPAQRRFAIRAMDLHDHRFPVTGRH